MKATREEVKQKFFEEGGLLSAVKLARKYGWKNRKFVQGVVISFKIAQVTRRVKPKYHKITARPKLDGKIDQIQVDLYDHGGKSKRKAALQGGFRYCLGAICVYSRRVWLFALKSKREKEVCDTLEKLYKEHPYQNFSGDREAAWTSRRFRTFAKNNDIKLWYNETWDPKKKSLNTAIIERFWRTFRLLLTRVQIRESDKRVFKHLNEIERVYNNTPHRSLGYQSPQQVFDSNMSPEEMTQPEIDELEIGQRVRTLISKGIFDKKGGQVWTSKTYEIIAKKGFRYTLDNKRSYLRRELLPVSDDTFNPRRSNRGRAVDNRTEALQSLPEDDKFKTIAPILEAPPLPPRRSTRLRDKKRVNYAD